jgi:hypothetical protein
MTFRGRLIEWAKLLDVGLNVVLGFDPEVETFSRRAGLARNAGKGWGCVVCRILDWGWLKITGVRDHCTNAVKAGEVE